MRIHNAATSRASYRVTVPAAVRVIRLIGDEGRTSFERTLTVAPALHERISLTR